ncbi:MAG TPA: histidine phosphatase family protein [Thermodesulfatator sp.]|nr:histidine phosphatase family protein [Thermodesulfatator sp.]
MNQPTKLWLVRHGLTRANQEGIFAGWTDEPLTPEGRLQAQEAGRSLAGEDIVAIYTSPVARTMETARIIGTFFPKASIVPEEGLGEIRIPQWEGKSKKDLLQHPELGYPLWKESPHLFRLPGAETLEALQQRAVSAVEKIACAHPGQAVALVSHLAVIRCLVLHYQGRPLSEYRKVKIANASPVLLYGRPGEILIDLHPFERP